MPLTTQWTQYLDFFPKGGGGGIPANAHSSTSNGTIHACVGHVEGARYSAGLSMFAMTGGSDPFAGCCRRIP